MKIVATIEARMSSNRLPGKSMKKILGKPMLELMIERIQNCNKIDEVVIATSSNPENDLIESLAKKIGVGCFRGSEDDVLDRVLKAAKSVNANIIVELWGDSPLIDANILNDLIDFYQKNDYDCVGTNLPNFDKTYPLGLSALIFPLKILDEVDKITQNPDDRENVSNYIYEHPDKYKIASLPCPKELNFPNLRLTVDEQNDFDLIEIIFRELYPKNSKFSAAEAIKFLNSNPKFSKMNRHVVQRRLAVWDQLKKS
jgi:spore coat polysaccharide biosynthesis protein SpsF